MAPPSITIANFKLLEPIGQGEMGCVYLAEQLEPAQQAAIRIISPDAGLPLAVLEALGQEAKIATRFQHPNLITVFDSGIIDEHFFLAMQHLPGGNLSARLDGPMDQDEAAHIIKAIGEALGYLHEQDFIHRDLEPASILFDERGRPVLADYGVIRGSDTQGLLTRLGYASGSPAYMSPEQILDKPLDGRSDLYSLGTVFFQMLSGKLPFTQDSTHALKQAKVSELPPRLPKHLRHYQIVIDRLLARNPDDRFADTGKLQIALDFRLQSTGEFPAPSSEDPPEPVLETIDTLKYRLAMISPKFWWALSGVVILLVAIWLY